jgi:hypothetical protein
MFCQVKILTIMHGYWFLLANIILGLDNNGFAGNSKQQQSSFKPENVN